MQHAADTTPDETRPLTNHIVLTGTVVSAMSPRATPDGSAVAFRLAVPRLEDAFPLHVDVVVLPGAGGEGLVPGVQATVAGRLDHQEWVGEDCIRRCRWLVVADEVTHVAGRLRQAG